MNTKLLALLSKPKLDTYTTSSLYHALWDNEHISKGMLESHLNPDENGATGTHKFVEQSVQWISNIAPLPRYRRLLDLGCGPGIYAEHFTKKGYSVTGIDYSKRSINYAIDQSTQTGSGIEYIYQNYLTIDYEGQFDVITIINKDYPVLSLSDRNILLGKVYQALAPGGKFVFDVFTQKVRSDEKCIWGIYDNGGFFNEEPYLLLEAIHQYTDDDQTQLHQYVVVTANDIACYICPNHYFSLESIRSEVMAFGFKAFEFYGNVAGADYSEQGEIICVVLTK